jgi:nicotinamide-nucleotide amidase
MKAQVISIGDELVLGLTVDTNSAWLSLRLAENGIQVVAHHTIADLRGPISEVIAMAAKESDAVLISGGLGPTEDDVTRESLADAMGVSLIADEEMIAEIEAFFRERNRIMSEGNRRQAMFPEGSEPIPNTCGTAPGINCSIDGAHVFVMPGVPSEMYVMFDRDVLPKLLQDARRLDRSIITHSVRCYGAGESDIGQRLSDLMARGRNPAVGTTAADGMITVRINVFGDSREAADRMLAETEDEVRRRLGELVFGAGDETLEHAVAERLKELGQTVSTAESCTGGLVSKSLTDVPGSSVYFLDGFICYSNEAKSDILGVEPELIESYGAVSVEVGEALAINCRQRSGSDYAIGVTGIAGPEGGSSDKPVGLVYIAIAERDGCDVHEHRFGAMSRHIIRDRACKSALNYLRLKLAK